MSRLCLSATALVSFGVAAVPPFAFDSRAAVKAATAYLRGEPIYVAGRSLNYDSPRVFAVEGQFGRHFIVVGFDAAGDPGGSFVVLEACPEGGPIVITLKGSIENFAIFRKFITDAITESWPVVPNRCPRADDA
jgi:hypothetical protein